MGPRRGVYGAIAEWLTAERRPIFLVLALKGCEPSPSFVDESYKEGTPYLNGSRRFLIP